MKISTGSNYLDITEIDDDIKRIKEYLGDKFNNFHLWGETMQEIAISNELIAEVINKHVITSDNSSVVVRFAAFNRNFRVCVNYSDILGWTWG